MRKNKFIIKIKEKEPVYIVDQNGKKTAVILPIRYYKELLEDLNDLRMVAKRSAEKTKDWENLKKKLSKNGII